MNNEILYRQIQGALKSTIAAHGAISKNFTASATKRIIGNLKQFEKISYPDEPLKEELIILASKQYHRLKTLRNRLESKKTKKDLKSHISGKCSELRTSLIEIGRLLNDGRFSKEFLVKDANSIEDTHLT
jgi:hypothetical protein